MTYGTSSRSCTSTISSCQTRRWICSKRRSPSERIPHPLLSLRTQDDIPAETSEFPLSNHSQDNNRQTQMFMSNNRGSDQTNGSGRCRSRSNSMSAQIHFNDHRPLRLNTSTPDHRLPHCGIYKPLVSKMIQMRSLPPPPQPQKTAKTPIPMIALPTTPAANISKSLVYYWVIPFRMRWIWRKGLFQWKRWEKIIASCLGYFWILVVCEILYARYRDRFGTYTKSLECALKQISRLKRLKAFRFGIFSADRHDTFQKVLQCYEPAELLEETSDVVSKPVCPSLESIFSNRIFLGANSARLTMGNLGFPKMAWSP